MDKNTGIGLVLIAAILIGFSLFNRPSQEELARRQHVQDSIAEVNRARAEAAAMQAAEIDSLRAMEGVVSSETTAEEKEALLKAQYGTLAPAAEGSNERFAVESKLLKLTFSPKGGIITKAELKNYKTYGDSINPLVLFDEQDKKQSFTLVTTDNRVLSTENLYFRALPISLDTAGNQVLTFRLQTVYPESYLDFVYTIPDSNYMIDFSIRAHEMQHVLAGNVNDLEMRWEQQIPQQERGRRFEERYAQLQYMFTNRDIEKLSESKADREKVASICVGIFLMLSSMFVALAFIADSPSSTFLPMSFISFTLVKSRMVPSSLRSHRPIPSMVTPMVSALSIRIFAVASSFLVASVRSEVSGTLSSSVCGTISSDSEESMSSA